MFIKLSFHEKKSHLFLPFGRFAFPFSVLSQLVYHEGSSFPVYGKSRESTFGRYTRLPGSVADFARRPVWDLGLHSAGLAVRFRSNSTTISVRWTNTFCNSMNHMAPTGVRGLDLYAWVDGGWRFVNCARPGSGKTTESRIVSDMVPGGARVHALPAALRRHRQPLDRR